jgi:hypothetical protein
VLVPSVLFYKAKKLTYRTNAAATTLTAGLDTMLDAMNGPENDQLTQFFFFWRVLLLRRQICTATGNRAPHASAVVLFVLRLMSAVICLVSKPSMHRVFSNRYAHMRALFPSGLFHAALIVHTKLHQQEAG